MDGEEFGEGGGDGVKRPAKVRYLVNETDTWHRLTCPGKVEGEIPERNYPTYVCRLCRRVCGEVVFVNHRCVPRHVVSSQASLGGGRGVRWGAGVGVRGSTRKLLFV